MFGKDKNDHQSAKDALAAEAKVSVWFMASDISNKSQPNVVM